MLIGLGHRKLMVAIITLAESVTLRDAETG
jgi:hypothetical protein